MEMILKRHFKAFISFLASMPFLPLSLRTNPSLEPPLVLDGLQEIVIQDAPVINIPTATRYNSAGTTSSSNRDDHKYQDLFGKMIIEFCFTTAIALLALSYQIQSNVDSHLSFSFHVFYLSILLAFSTSWGGILLRLRYLSTAKVLEQMGIMFAAVAFFLAIEMSVPPSLKWLTWLICVFSLFFLFIYYIYDNTHMNNAA